MWEWIASPESGLRAQGKDRRAVPRWARGSTSSVVSEGPRWAATGYQPDREASRGAYPGWWVEGNKDTRPNVCSAGELGGPLYMGLTDRILYLVAMKLVEPIVLLASLSPPPLGPPGWSRRKSTMSVLDSLGKANEKPDARTSKRREESGPRMTGTSARFQLGGL
ncbi:hypothetical protein N7462_010464 [Penicillium macrosclerotiorum]|uniref:uncharacterized protein n=1 Tax=Penicillium macrosclerotiorum TaxID=303699 RepID=UPI0025468B16|nr:uncharacterized protein N7462_010464 [Penicillium macrosclerotiorum]KAJ5669394.1 hypothetical protein N7462_010464 [Penicillium macrosclerotiorum]